MKHCQKCGEPLVNRPGTAKYCYSCSDKLAIERKNARRKLKKLFILVLGGILYATVSIHPVQADESTRRELQNLSRRVKAQDDRREARALLKHRIDRTTQFLGAHSSPLVTSAGDFVRCGDKFGINPGVLIGITNAESTMGKHYSLRNNPFNWGVHDGVEFASMGQAICHVAEKLKTMPFYAGKSVLEIGKIYAPALDHNNPSHWASVVEGTAKEINI